MESKIFLIFLDNMDAGCQFVGYARSEEAAEKVCEELNATTPWDFRSSDYQYLELDCLEHE